MAFIKSDYGDYFMDTDKNFDQVLCPYGNRKPCTWQCAKLRVRKEKDGGTTLIFNCGGRPMETECYTFDEWDKLHPQKELEEQCQQTAEKPL